MTKLLARHLHQGRHRVCDTEGCKLLANHDGLCPPEQLFPVAPVEPSLVLAEDTPTVAIAPAEVLEEETAAGECWPAPGVAAIELAGDGGQAATR